MIQQSNTTLKPKLRKHYRAIRGQIPITYRRSAALTAANHLIQQKIFNRSEHIACYLFYKDEFDTSSIIEAIWHANKHCYLPILTEENSLRFVRYNNGDALHLNRYSILEPVNIAHERSPENLDIVITPLVAFDLHGHRLGTGGGYYDRTFSFLDQHTRKRPLMMGLAYTAQQAESLPYDAWDVLLDGVVTENEFILFSKK